MNIEGIVCDACGTIHYGMHRCGTTVGRVVPAAGKGAPRDFELAKLAFRADVVKENDALRKDNARLRELARGLCRKLREERRLADLDWADELAALEAALGEREG